MSAGRTVAGLLTPETAAPVRDYLAAAAAALRDGSPMPEAPASAEPFDALLIERANALLLRMGDADKGIEVLDGADLPLPEIVLRPTHDIPAAFISGVRTSLAFGLTAAFAVLAGWPGATLMLIQQAAFVGLLGAVPTPTIASKGFLLPLFPVALVVGLVEFLVLPLTSGFVPFALIVGGLMFVTGVLVRHKKLAAFAGAAFIYVTLLLSPTNPASYDLSTFCNTLLQVFLAVVFTLLTFLLIMPVSPKRRLYRVVAAVGRQTHRTRVAPSGTPNAPVAQARLYDRLVRALTYLGQPTGARRALLSHLYRLGACDIAFNRARTGLDGIADAAERPTIEAARAALAARDFEAMLEAARALLAVPGLWPAPSAQQAVSGLAEIAFQEGPDHSATRFYRWMMG